MIWAEKNATRPCLIVNRSEKDEAWEAAYITALSKVLRLSRDDINNINLGSMNGQHSSAVTAGDFERLSGAQYVIADTTYGDARTYMLLGFALANRKQILHLHGDHVRPHPRIPGVSSKIYSSPAELKSYLEQVLGFISLSGDGQPPELRDFMQRCGFPLIVLEGDGRYGYSLPTQYGERPIYVGVADEKFMVPEPWRSEFARVRQRQLDYALTSGSVLFNGELVRMLDYVPLRDERLGTRGIRIDAQLTDYFTFVSSNHCWDYIGPEAAIRLREQEVRDLGNMRTSVLANPLTVSVSLIVRDGGREWMLIQRRNRDKNFHGKQDFTCAAAGMVSASRDRRSGEIDVYATACNELREETGIRVRDEQIVFLGLLRESQLREVGLVSEVAMHGDASKLLGPRPDAFEAKGFVLCEANPEAFAQFLRNNLPVSRFAPLSAGALIFSLLRRFSRERVEAAFSDFVA